MKQRSFVVLTPTYQRASTLPRLYKSLLKQTFKDFCWFIIDDGSTDDTKNVISKLSRESKIDIHYLYQSNMGKHRAIATALRSIPDDQYRYIYAADSDDELLPQTLEIFHKHLNEIEESGKSDEIVYVKSRCYRNDGVKIPYKTPNDRFIECSYIDVTFKNGDFEEYDGACRLTDYKKYLVAPEKFWLSEHVKFFPEGVVWARVGGVRNIDIYLNIQDYIMQLTLQTKLN